MKKFILIFTLIIGAIAFTGCKANRNEDIVAALGQLADNMEHYEAKGTMTTTHGSNDYTYDISVTFQKPDYYKVILTNQETNDSQIIIKNDDGVFVLTPALNKSFKFKSDWPLNGSQSYILQSTIKDIVNDENVEIKKEEGKYIIDSKTNYNQMKNLVRQKIIIDEKTKLPKEVAVYDDNDQRIIHVIFSSFDLEKSYDKSDFDVEENMRVAILKYGDGIPVFSDRVVEYPTFTPENVSLSDELIEGELDNQKAIMSFAGDKDFTVIQTNISFEETIEYIRTTGEITILDSSIAVISDSSIQWIENGNMFMILSNNLSTEELIEVANSFYIDAK